MKKEFNEFFEDINIDKLTNIWNLAKAEKVKRRKVYLTVIGIVDIVLLIAYFLCIGIHIDMFSIMPMVTLLIFIDVFCYLIIFFVIGNNRNNEYNSLFKTEIVEKLLKNAFSDVDYIPIKEMPREIYKEGEYDGYYNRYYSDDYADVYIDDQYPMKMAEILTQRVETHRDSKGRTHTRTTTIFSGIFAKINMKKSINCQIRIKEDGGFYNRNINMDSTQFEKYFDVDCSDKVITMQLLTHDIMDMLINFRKILGAPFDILIINNVMYIRLHVGKVFESVINKYFAVDVGTVKRYYNIIDFLDTIAKELIKNIENTEI